MGLSLVVGPAHAGKVALLLERYLEVLDRDPWLVVPNRADVERVEWDLLRRRSALLAGRIGTFDDLFEHVAESDPEKREVATDAQRALAVRRAIDATALGNLAASAGSGGFADVVLGTIGELESALLDPDRVDGDLGKLARAYRGELDRLGLWDRDGLRRCAAARLGSDLDAWHGEPVLAYGFEDLTGAEWALLEALAARTDVTVSIPYEPGRAAFSALERTVEDLAGLAHGAVEELPRSDARPVPTALAHLERELFQDTPSRGEPLDGSLHFFEGAGVRGTVELLAAEVLALIRAGTPPERIGVVCESADRWRAPLEAVLGPLGIPYSIEHRFRLGETPLGRALVALLRFGWHGAGRAELFVFLRSPFSGLERRAVDFVEGRLRGRAIVDPVRVEEESERLRGAPVPALVDLRAEEEPVRAARRLLRTMMRNAWGLDSPPTADDARGDSRVYQAVDRTLGELEAFAILDGRPVSPEEVVASLERTRVRPATATERGRVAVLDYERARTRLFDVVFLLGLEEGSLPRRERPSPLLDDDARRALGGRLERPSAVARDRYLFYTACTRAAERLVLVREAASDDGVPREPSPFWDDVRSLFDLAEVARATRRRPLSSLTWTLDSAPSERERLRAVARLTVDDTDSAAALALSNGWSRRLDRALEAFDRPTRLSSPAVLETMSGKTTFSATELERFADCSSAWLVERVIDPKTIDAEPDPMLRGQVAHTALNRFYSSLPRELDAERVTPENLEAALVLVRRCLDDALESGVRLDLTELQRAELRHTLIADLEGFVRDEAESEMGFVPRRLEVAFGSERAAPELQRGLPLGDGLRLSGKIDRIDIDPFSARGIVQDYKSGKGAHSARDIDRDLRLQIPLYLLALRDLVGVEPLGGVYRALSGKRLTRGMLRESAREDLPGFAKDDYLDEDAFWAQVETARERAGTNAQRIRAGDVKHDPKGDGCPSWCDLWPICRVDRG
ncbi:MAG: PD-(D/E)XK nuclease family protein [Actinobacteria bacterium]|nr:PD-(D/E)XK nuclease family protein [Actinomycetota bacterium]